VNNTYIQILRERQGSISVGASTARGMGPKGTIQAARAYLQSVELSRFRKSSMAAFLKELDLATGELSASLPKGARRWGSARKFINIFLRGCVYNKYLCAHFSLQNIEAWLEVPLDSHVAKGLKSIAARGHLPRWRGVVNLTPTDSEAYQLFASSVSRTDGVNRVDLDVRFWRRVA